MNEEIYHYAVNARRYLHQIPEIGFDLYQTSDFIRKELKKMGYVTEATAKTGIVAYRPGKQPRSICFRADMDALRILEKTGLPFSSVHEGCMHACGHDGHMAMVLGLAKAVSLMPETELSLLFLFQPAEEGPGGAEVIVEEGILEKYRVSSIFGVHLFPLIEEGKIGLREGPMMAQSGEFTTRITGKSSHGAQPHLGHDAILASGNLITAYHSIISRNFNPLSSNVITIGTIQGGDAMNIIASDVTMTGTVRSFKEEEYQFLKRRMQELNEGISHAFGVQINTDFCDRYPPVMNDSLLYKKIRASLPEEEIILPELMMISEDFAYYQKAVPGLFALIGCKNEAKGYVNPLHSCCFDFNEEVLSQGIRYLLTVLKVMNDITKYDS